MDGLGFPENGSTVSTGGEFRKCDACLGNNEFSGVAPLCGDVRMSETWEASGCQAMPQLRSVGSCR